MTLSSVRSIAMRVRLAMTVWLVSSGGSPAIAQGSATRNLTFLGEFSQIVVDGDECEAIFTPREYSARHVLTGPTRRIALLHFSREGEDDGFFDGMNLTSLYGPDGDVYYEKLAVRPDGTYDLLLRGFVTPEFILLEARAEKLSEDRMSVLCTATAEFAAFGGEF